MALEHIAACHYPADKYEIVLVNNKSTDNTEQECRRFEAAYPDVPMRYFLETNQGLSHARNRGIAEAKGDVLVFLDDDSLVCPDYLQHLEAYVERYPDMMAFGGRIAPLFESGKEPEWLGKWSYSWVSAINKGDAVCLFEGSSYPIGANMGFRRSCIEMVGVFNTSLGRTEKNLMGGEEKDIFSRVRDKGYKIYYFPDINIQHVIPERRTTDQYIVRMAQGIGASERLRTRQLGGNAYAKRLLSEVVKWGGTMVLLVGYTLRLQWPKGSKLVLFRHHVTRGLLGIS